MKISIKFKKDDIRDERIVLEKMKIESKAYNILFAGLLIITVVQMAFFDAKPAQIAGEFSLFLFMGTYVIIQKLRNSIPLFPQEIKSKKQLIFSSIISLIIAFPFRFFIVKGESMRGHIISTIFWLILLSILYSIFFNISNKRQKKIDIELDKEENYIEDELDKKDDYIK